LNSHSKNLNLMKEFLFKRKDHFELEEACRDIDQEQISQLAVMCDVKRRATASCDMEIELEDHIYHVNRSLMIGKEQEVREDSLLETLALVGIRAEVNVVPKFHPASAIIGEIGEKGTLEYRGGRIEKIFIPRMYGGKFTRKMVNKMDVLSPVGNVGILQQNRLFMGLRPIRGKTDTIVFQIRINGGNLSIFWDNYDIRVLEDINVFGWYREEGGVYYDYTHYGDFSSLNCKSVIKVHFEYLSRDLLSNSTCDMQALIDGKLFFLSQEKSFVLQYIRGVYRDKNDQKYEVSGVPSFSGMCEIRIRKGRYFFFEIRQDRYVPDSTQDIMLLRDKVMVVGELVEFFFLYRGARLVLENIKLSAAIEERRVAEYNKRDSDFVYGILEMQDLISDFPFLSSLVGKSFNVMRFLERGEKNFVYGKVCELYSAHFSDRHVFKSMVVDVFWESGSVRVPLPHRDIYLRSFGNRDEYYMVTFSMKLATLVRMSFKNLRQMHLDRMYVLASVTKVEWKEFYKENENNISDLVVI